ncbi:MAG: DUF3850 domain-containing protein [Sphingomonadales bacterium]|nr:MAG: DUF3850 domain-containing protein [Sphingomonadales bacterium]
MAIHELKTWPQYWWAVAEEGKNFEVRRDDRGFQKGDLVILLCFDPKEGRYMKSTSKFATSPDYAMKIEREISWILTGGQHGIEAGHVVLGLGPLSI